MIPITGLGGRAVRADAVGIEEYATESRAIGERLRRDGAVWFSKLEFCRLGAVHICFWGGLGLAHLGLGLDDNFGLVDLVRVPPLELGLGLACALPDLGGFR